MRRDASAALVPAARLARAAALALLAAALAPACSLWEDNPLYCDGASRPCTDPLRPRCDLVAHECRPQDDGGSLQDGAVPDGNLPDGDLPDGPPGDGGCGVCPTATPICDPGTGACRICTAHAECVARDPSQPACTSGTCHPNRCGDTYVDTSAGERCDDGNTDNGDGCDPTCRYTGTVTTIAGQSRGGGYCDDVGLAARIGPRFATIEGSAVYFTEGTAVRKMALPSYAVTTFAGNGFEQGYADGAAAQARFEDLMGIVSDGTYLYVADSGSSTIRRITIATGATITIAGAAGQPGSIDDAALGLNARFDSLGGLAHYKDAVKNTLFIADSQNCTIRTIDLNQAGFPVTTLAGAAGQCSHADGTLANARFNHPQGLATESPGSVYVADTDNHVIRKISGTSVSTYCGTPGTSGSDNGTGGAATFSAPTGITMSPTTGNLFVSDTGNLTVRLVQPNISLGAVSTLAGAPGQAGTTDGTGSTARFVGPRGLVAGGFSVSGDVFVPDGPSERRDDRSFRRVTTAGAVATVAGASAVWEMPVSVDGVGTQARLANPWGLTATTDGLFIGDRQTCLLRQMSLSTLNVTTVAGMANHCTMSDGTGGAAAFLSLIALWNGGTSVWVADGLAVREYLPTTGEVHTRAGSSVEGTQDGDGSDAGFKLAARVVSDGTYLYVSDYGTIRRVSIASPWTVQTILGAPGVLDGVDGTGSSARLGAYMGLQIVGTKLYVSDVMSASLRVVDLTVQPYSITTVAGVLKSPGTDDGVGTAARFYSPYGLAWDGTSLFVADVPRIRQVDPTTMRVTTLVGQSNCIADVDGDHSKAALNVSVSLAYSETTGYLYVTDSDTVREIR